MSISRDTAHGPADPGELARRKQSLRRELLARRRALDDRHGRAEAIWRAVTALPEYAAAETVLAYVDVRSEVPTRPFLPGIVASGRRLVVPYCAGDELELFRLEEMDELAAGRFGVLEPAMELRDRPHRRVAAGEIDLALLPGVAFDRRGGRLGYGKGYFDRLLAGASARTTRLGLAFECQLVSAVPLSPHDVPMHRVVTEKSVHGPA